MPTLTGDLGSLVGADFPTPTDQHVAVILETPGGGSTVATAAVEADGDFSMADIPAGAYRLSVLWRTGIPGVPLQSIVVDPASITADVDLTALLAAS